MLTPLPWRRPWKVASQVATLDQLSDGRAILSVGLGAPDVGHGAPVDALDRATRAAQLDDALDLIEALWSGALEYHGTHYDVELHDPPIGPFRPVQQPRPPIWVVGAWPRPKSMRRVATKGDGLLPNVMVPDFRPATTDDIRAMAEWLRDHGARRSGAEPARRSGTEPVVFDVVTEGSTPTDPAAAATVVQPWADAGCTWWLEAL